MQPHESTKLLSLRGYAKHRNASPSSVHEAIQSGRITAVKNPAGKIEIDPVQADAEWEKNTDHSKRNNSRDPEKESKSQRFDYQEERAKREHYLAEIARLEFEKQAKLSVSFENIGMQIVSSSKQLKEALFNIPKRLSAQLALETSAIKVDALITQEIHATLEDFLKEIQRVIQPK